MIIFIHRLTLQWFNIARTVILVWAMGFVNGARSKEY